MKRPRLTDRVLRGLGSAMFLADADMAVDQSDKSPNYTAEEAADFGAAYRWVALMHRYREEKKAARKGAK